MSVSETFLPTFRELALPARDLARGLRHAMGRSRRLGSVRGAVPDPLRDLIRGVVGGVEGAANAARDVTERLAPRAASPSGLASILVGPEPALRFAEAARHGLEAAVARMGRDDMMASDTIAAMAYRAAEPEPGPTRLPQTAARLAASLAHHHAVGVAPGTPIAMGTEENRLAMLASFAVMLWLTVDRDGAREDEAALLALCVDLTLSLSHEIAAAGADPDKLASLIAAYREVV